MKEFNENLFLFLHHVDAYFQHQLQVKIRMERMREIDKQTDRGDLVVFGRTWLKVDNWCK